jgi:hypothetical protein
MITKKKLAKEWLIFVGYIVSALLPLISIDTVGRHAAPP